MKRNIFLFFYFLLEEEEKIEKEIHGSSFCLNAAAESAPLVLSMLSFDSILALTFHAMQVISSLFLRILHACRSHTLKLSPFSVGVLGSNIIGASLAFCLMPVTHALPSHCSFQLRNRQWAKSKQPQEEEREREKKKKNAG